MIEKERAERIISMMMASDVQKKLDAINEARKLFPDWFKPEENDAQWAHNAMILEQLYNLFRETLQVKQIRIRHDIEGVATPKTAKAPSAKKEKKKPATIDMGSMMAAFAEWNKKQ